MEKQEILQKLSNIIAAIYLKSNQIAELKQFDPSKGVTPGIAGGMAGTLINPIFGILGIGYGMYKAITNDEKNERNKADITKLEQEISALMSSAIVLSQQIYPIDDYGAMVMAITDIQQAYATSTDLLAGSFGGKYAEACNLVLSILPEYVSKESEPRQKVNR